MPTLRGTYNPRGRVLEEGGERSKLFAPLGVGAGDVGPEEMVGRIPQLMDERLET